MYIQLQSQSQSYVCIIGYSNHYLRNFDTPHFMNPDLTMSRQSLTLVFTDSRGKCLDTYIDHDNIKVKYYKGVGLLQLIDLADHFIRYLNPTCVLFIAGICDLTFKDRLRRKIRLRYDNFYDMFHHLSEQFTQARLTTDSRYPHLMVAYGGVCGMDLNRYNREPGFSIHQRLIDRVIVAIDT